MLVNAKKAAPGGMSHQESSMDGCQKCPLDHLLYSSISLELDV
jgi:hypothetical protein